jgi:uncharacterized protein
MLPTDVSLKPTEFVVLQPTPFCNIACRYCYLPQHKSVQIMSPAILTRILETLFSSSLLADTITLMWHAGEPLIAPLTFYQEAFELIRRFNTRGVSIVHAIQTNGMRITQPWCDFINEHNIHMGVSLDGPQHMHDRNRIDRAGQGTHARVLQGLHLLQQNKIAPSILMVLTNYSLDYPDEIWGFLREHDLHNVSFNIEEINGANTHSSLENEEDIKRYKRFLRRILTLREKNAFPLSFREIDLPLARIRYLTEPVFSQENAPGSILNFDYQGNVTTFASELLTMTDPQGSDFLLGNVLDQSLAEMFSQPKFLAINESVQQGVARCQATCAYFDVCGGGSPVNKISEHGTFDVAETMYCKLKIQASLEATMEHLEARYLAG